MGALLAGAIARIAHDPARPVLVIPVPSTAGARRERHGDHMMRLATHAARRLRTAGWRAVEITQPFQALPRVDSASLSAVGRAAAAENSLRIRRPRIAVSRHGTTMRGTLVVVDDIVTTGATLAAMTARLREVNVQVTGAAVLAATKRRSTPPGEFAEPGRTGHA